MNTTHTPGPWALSAEGYIYHVSGGYVPIRTPFREDAFVDGPRRSDHPESVVMSNARLIAAAPDLLSALQTAADLVCYLKPERYDNAEHEAEFQRKLDLIYSAIAKAEGR